LAFQKPLPPRLALRPRILRNLPQHAARSRLLQELGLQHEPLDLLCVAFDLARVAGEANIFDKCAARTTARRLEGLDETTWNLVR
jgi:hypothetical protein